MLETREMKDIVELDYMLMDTIGDLVLKLSEDVYEECFEDYIRFTIKYVLIMNDFAGRYNISSRVIEYMDKTDMCETRLLGLYGGYEKVLRNVDAMESLRSTRVGLCVLGAGDALYDELDECLLNLMEGIGGERKEQVLFNKVKGLYRDLLRSVTVYGKSYFKEKDDFMFFLNDEKAFVIDDGEVFLHPKWEEKIKHSIYFSKFVEEKEKYESENCGKPFVLEMVAKIQRCFKDFIDDMKYNSSTVNKCVKEKKRLCAFANRMAYEDMVDEMSGEMPGVTIKDSFEKLVEFGGKFLNTFLDSEYMEGTTDFLCNGWQRVLQKVDYYMNVGNGVITSTKKKALTNQMKHWYIITERRMKSIDDFNVIRIKDILS